MMGPRKQKTSWETYLIYKVMQVFSYHKYLALMWNNVLWVFFFLITFMLWALSQVLSISWISAFNEELCLIAKNMHV